KRAWRRLGYRPAHCGVLLPVEPGRSRATISAALLDAPRPGSAYASELRGELIEPHGVGDAPHFAALLVGEAHDQREGCGFQPLHFRAVRIERGDFGAGGATTLAAAVTRFRIRDGAQCRFHRRPHLLLIGRQVQATFDGGDLRIVEYKNMT